MIKDALVTQTLSTFFRAVPPATHGGVDAQALQQLGIAPEAVIDFSANQSPLGASPRVHAAMARAALEQYPDRDAFPLANAIAHHCALAPAQVVVGNGSTELIRLIAQLALRPGDAAYACTPTFGEYAVATRLAGGTLLGHEVAPGQGLALETFMHELAWHSPRICWLCSPNNPTGLALAPELIAALVTRHPQTLFVLDEAYIELLPAPQWTAELLSHGNLIVLRSMTKAWGLAGLRLGFALGADTLMAPLRAAKPPWNVNACAQEAGQAALEDAEHYHRTVLLLREQKTVLSDGLRAMGWGGLPSDAAFFLVEVGNAPATQQALLAHGCLVRDCTSFGLPAHIRLSPRLPEQNRRLLEAFATLPRAGGTQ